MHLFAEFRSRRGAEKKNDIILEKKLKKKLEKEMRAHGREEVGHTKLHEHQRSLVYNRHQIDNNIYVVIHTVIDTHTHNLHASYTVTQLHTQSYTQIIHTIIHTQSVTQLYTHS